MSDVLVLDGRVAVVTGALGLLGKEHCRALAKQGAVVVATDLDASACAAFCRELPGDPEKHLGVGADITQQDDVAALRAAVMKRFDRVDVLVNNAAVDDKFTSASAAAELSKFENYPLELFKKSLEVNVVGTFLCSQILGAEMARAGRGSIINIASTYGVVAPDQSIYRKPDGSQTFWKSAAYPTTKGAVLSFTRFLSTYFGPRGVRVNALSPGGVENGQDRHFVDAYSARTPLGRMAKSTDYAGALVFLASDASSYMTGANLIVDGGWTVW